MSLKARTYLPATPMFDRQVERKGACALGAEV